MRETERPTEALTAVRRAALQDPDLPSGLRRALESGAALEDIALDDRGRWWHEGVRIEHKRLSTLFHRGLEQTNSGTWLIALPPYSYPVHVARWGGNAECARKRGSSDGVDGDRRRGPRAVHRQKLGVHQGHPPGGVPALTMIITLIFLYLCLYPTILVQLMRKLEI